MDERLARFAVDRARALGAQYAEARIQRNLESEAILRNGNPEPAVIGDALGIGIRVLVNGSLAFSATNMLTEESVRSLVEGAIKRAKSAAKFTKQKIGFSNEKSHQAKWSAPEKKNIENVGIEDLARVLKELDNSIKNGKNGVEFPNRLFFLRTMLVERIYVNSDGANLRGRVPRLQFHSYISAKHSGKTSTVTIPAGYAQLGESGGWEVLDRFNLFEYVPKTAEELADVVKAEKKPPTETVDVILGPEVSGLVSHESCGHPGEADRILGREGAQAGESYLKSNDIGYKIGSEQAFVSDDPTLPNSMGFYLYDEEGVPARKRALISKGIISSFLHNRESAHDLNTSSNASARSVRYDREPIVRMANTYIEPGDYTFEGMVKDVKLGVYIKSFMEWNIDDKRLNQRYVGLESYLIEKGEVKHHVKDPILEITTPKLYGSLDARGNDLKFMGATCGKGDPMQGIPVWTGGPHVRLRNIRVAAR